MYDRIFWQFRDFEKRSSTRNYPVELWSYHSYLAQQYFLRGTTYLNLQSSAHTIKNAIVAWLENYNQKNNMPSFSTLVIDKAVQEWQRRQWNHDRLEILAKENLRRHMLAFQQIAGQPQNQGGTNFNPNTQNHNFSNSTLNQGLPNIMTFQNMGQHPQNTDPVDARQNNQPQMNQQVPQQNNQQNPAPSKPRSVSPLKIKIPKENGKK